MQPAHVSRERLEHYGFRGYSWIALDVHGEMLYAYGSYNEAMQAAVRFPRVVYRIGYCS